ncbi:MAG: translation initiation factor IF-2 [Actinobacteria bacterium]|nr:translation initiation factor IF-2 [Actinomycetota bacterium]
MGSYRIYQIAKENNLTSKELIDICAKIGVDAKSHSSSVSEENLRKILDFINNSKENSYKNLKKEKDIKEKDILKNHDGEVNKTESTVLKNKIEANLNVKSYKKITKVKNIEAQNKKIGKYENINKNILKDIVTEEENIKINKLKENLKKDKDFLRKKEKPGIVDIDSDYEDKDLDKIEKFKEASLRNIKENIKNKPLKWEEEKRINVRSVLLKELDKEDKLIKSRGKPAFSGKVKNIEDIEVEQKLKKKKEEKKDEEEIKKRPEIKKLIELPSGVTIKQLSERINVPSSEIIKTLFKLGEVITINQPLDDDLIEILSSEYNFKFTIIGFENKLDELYKDEPQDLVLRPPIVTVMGHVDHGKTTLLDAIRKSDVAGGEAGGITQHIGAYQIEYKNRKITFIDTPGHEAFTSMRARGARVTDIAVIVVAANDGIMPQSVEAIDHAKAASVPVIVAINKIDLPDADPEKVKKGLTEYGLVPEEWGGDTICVEVSAKNKINIDELLEMILLVADMHEIKGNPNAEGYGIIIESRLDKGMGPVGSVIVKRGTIKVGDFFITGNSYGRVRALQDDKGNKVTKAYLSQPVEIVGFSSVPNAGDKFFVVKNEKVAKELLSKKLYAENLFKISEGKRHITLEQLSEIAKSAEVKKLGIILKADVNGSLDAVEQALKKIETEEIKIDIIHKAVGAIVDSDIILATASNAIVIGFGVVPTAKAKAIAKIEKVEIRTYEVIYKLIDDLVLAFKGMLEPKTQEVEKGRVEVREVFKMPKVGLVAGCYVLEGEVERSNPVRIVRDGKIIFNGKISSIHRFKEDVKKVTAGYECGIKIENFQDINKGDFFEVYEIKEIS